MGRRPLIAAIIAATILSSLTSCPCRAETVYWHLDPGVETCSMALDPSLTQAQWETFAREAGSIISFKSMAPAHTLARFHYTLDLDYATTPIDQHDPAWINTFVHPDADCPLGDNIEFPAVRGRMGISQRMDLGAYWTTAPGANYGFAGGEIRYAFMRESNRAPAASVSTSGMWLTGVPDFNFAVYSVGVAASKRVAMFTPYAGVRENFTVATEHTSKVDLDNENIFMTQGFVGATCSWWMIGVGAEYDIADVNTFSFVIGFHP